MKTLLIIAALCLIASTILLGYSVLSLADLLTNYPDPAPITYETGLYVESDQVQETIAGKELQ